MLRKLRALLTAMLAAISSSGYAQAVYVLTDPVPAAKIGCWARHFPKYDQIVGYSNLGHFFLRASKDNEYIVLHPFKKAAKSYGQHSSNAAFENEVLKDPGFADYVLRPDHVAAIRKRLGPLKAGEIYIPQPYPFIGGSDEPDTYAKGNVWVFADIVAQMQGLCD